MVWTGAKVIVFVLIALIIATAVAGVELLNPIRGIKFCSRGGKASYQYHGNVTAPGQP